MIKILLFVILTPLFVYSQNIITTAYITKDSTLTADISDYDIYTLKIRPGYHDHGYKFELIKNDSSGKEIVLSEPEINVNLIVHKKNIRMGKSDKVEWDYETEVKSNDIWTDEYIEIGDCSNTKYLTILFRVKRNENHRIKVYHNEKYFLLYILTDKEIIENLH